LIDKGGIFFSHHQNQGARNDAAVETISKAFQDLLFGIGKPREEINKA
jgi:hypothetical protein